MEVDAYALFAEELRLAQDGQLDILDDQQGLLMRWAAVCEQRMSAEQDMLDEDEQAEEWALERNTWQLMQSIYTERLDEDREAASTSKMPYKPPLSSIQRLIVADRNLSELSAIRDWLHTVPTALNPAEVRRGYQPYTKSKLKQTRRTGGAAPRGLVSELDPDATLRLNADNERVDLDADDAGYERALVRSLYEYVRAGSLDLAIDMCRQSDQSWRAASLAGGQPWWNKTLAAEPFEDDAMMGGADAEHARGNLSRKLWKQMCLKLASSPQADPYERALYGAVAGDTPSVLPVCSTWEDHLWVHINALFESTIDARLDAIPDSRFWTKGSTQPLDGAARAADVRTELERILDSFLRNDRELGESARSPFHVAQAWIMMGKLSDLLETFVNQLEMRSRDLGPERVANLLRFFAHLVLVLRLLKQPLPPRASNEILQAYIKVLEAENKDEALIAFYASNLESEDAIESFAQFLSTFRIETDYETRRDALLQAREHGLDVAQIACRTVELLLADLLEELPELSYSGSVEMYARLETTQLELIRLLEWLVIDPATYHDALSQANPLIRYFLLSGAPHAARELITRFPASVLAACAQVNGEGTLSDDAREFLDYQGLFGTLEKHTRWLETWSRKPLESATKLEITAYNDTISALVDELHEATIDLLTSDWLSSDDESAPPRKQTEIKNVRRIYVPELVLRLHTTLAETVDTQPTSLPRALHLAQVVADEKHRVYVEFITDERNRLGDYLRLVRDVSLKALGSGIDPLSL